MQRTYNKKMENGNKQRKQCKKNKTIYKMKNEIKCKKDSILFDRL